MLRLAGLVATLAGWLSRRLGRGGGTTLPGVILLKLRPGAIAEMSNRMRHGTVLCSATNGKTTTTHLIVAAVEASGRKVVTNAEGSNLERGVAAALLAGDRSTDIGIFEVDEAALLPVARATEPRVLVLMNLFRDQLDRYGELETLVDKWSDLLDELESRHPPSLVLNADDPNIAEIGRGRTDVTWFGVDDVRRGQPARAHAADAINCRRCGGPLAHDVVLLGHLGHWRCTRCDARRPTPDVAATRIDATADGGQDVAVEAAGHEHATTIEISSPLPGLHNAYNLTAAVAAAWALAERTGIEFDATSVGQALAGTSPAFGRGESITVGDKLVRLLLAKNPTGVNQNLRTLLDEPGNAHVLAVLNDGTADGQDISWIWDVDWEVFEPRLASLTVGGDRAHELALRFRYGGFDMTAVSVETDIPQALDAALGRVPAGATLHVLPTYTAMLALRAELADRGLVEPYWADAP